MKNYKYILLLLASLLGLGCPGPEEVPAYYVSQEMLRYCWFPDGSYWIYELEGSPGVIDSVNLKNASHNIFQDDGDDYISESYGFTLQIQNKQRSFTAISWPVGQNREHTLTQMTEIYADSMISQIDYVLFWDTRGRDTLSSHSITSKVHNDSLQVGGITYHEVIEVVTTPFSASEYVYGITWAKDIGMIRRKLKTGEIWNLKSYHINY